MLSNIRLAEGNGETTPLCFLRNIGTQTRTKSQVELVYMIHC